MIWLAGVTLDQAVKVAQLVMPVVTFLAVIVALRVSFLNSKWRRDDFAAERRRVASGVRLSAEVDSVTTDGQQLYTRINAATVFNRSNEVINNVVIQFMNGHTGAILNMAMPSGHELLPATTTKLLLNHLAAGEEKGFRQFTTDKIPVVEVDGERRPDFTFTVRWTDAAGWQFIFDGSDVRRYTPPGWFRRRILRQQPKKYWN